MTYTLSNTCAKNLCKRTLLVQLIIKNVVTCFLEHSVNLKGKASTRKANVKALSIRPEQKIKIRSRPTSVVAFMPERDRK